jgi:GNAT superfamily N-acetyltransferase
MGVNPMDTKLSTYTMRSYHNDEDYWRMRNFLREAMVRNGRREICWHVARLDYWWWFCNPDLEKLSLEENIFLWETGEGKIAALLLPEGRGQAFPQIHPQYFTAKLYEQVVIQAEERLSTMGRDGRKKVWVYVDVQDKSQQEILASRGFQRVEHTGEQEYQHRRSLDEPLPDGLSTPGYTIRAMGDGLELLERCYASGLGFHDDDIHTARDNRDQPQWYHHIQTAPLYRRDLDIVAVAADGSIASFCTMWFDDVSRTAYIEPVATVPAHQKRGLGKAVIIEGLQRLKRMGCKVAFVGGYSPAANALYFSVMGPDHDISEPWEKMLQVQD